MRNTKGWEAFDSGVGHRVIEWPCRELAPSDFKNLIASFLPPLVLAASPTPKNRKPTTFSECRADSEPDYRFAHGPDPDPESLVKTPDPKRALRAFRDRSGAALLPK